MGRTQPLFAYFFVQCKDNIENSIDGGTWTWGIWFGLFIESKKQQLHERFIKMIRMLVKNLYCVISMASITAWPVCIEIWNKLIFSFERNSSRLGDIRQIAKDGKGGRIRPGWPETKISLDLVEKVAKGVIVIVASLLRICLALMLQPLIRILFPSSQFCWIGQVLAIIVQFFSSKLKRAVSF